MAPVADLIEHFEKCPVVHELVADKNVHALLPIHVIRLLQSVVAGPARDWHNRRVVLDKVFLLADLKQHGFHYIRDFLLSRLLVADSVAVHHVHADVDLFHVHQVDELRVLTSLFLYLVCLVISLRNGHGSVTICRHLDESNISLRGTDNHALDEVAVPENGHV